jgi:hypothetical protein
MSNSSQNLGIEAKLLELFKAYVEQVQNNPIKVHDFVGKEGDSVYRKKERPLTMEGYRVFCRENGLTVKKYFTNKDSKFDYLEDCCDQISDHIRKNQIEGGLVGIFNPSIVQRLNGLVEKSFVETKQEQPLFA